MNDAEIKHNKITILKQSDMQKCEHFIMVPEHYRRDGSCRCDDVSHVEMDEWGYAWNGNRWK
jgi:uncharacterized phage-associated protein